MNNKKNNVTLEEYENSFSYKKSKTNLNIEFNRIAFIFFIFLAISIIYSIQLFHLGSLKKDNANKWKFIFRCLFQGTKHSKKIYNRKTIWLGFE